MSPAQQASLGRATRRRVARLLAGLLAASAVLMVMGACIGSTGLESLRALRQDEVARQIVWQIRLPRTLGAWAAGGLLGLAGAVAQGLFRNPLADPYLLGSASGASLAVALAMVGFDLSPSGAWWLARLGLTGAAFVGAVGAVLLTMALARGARQTLRLLLAGVIVGVVLGALSNLTVSMAPRIMAAQQAFMLGGTGFVDLAAAMLMLAIGAACVLATWALSPVLDALALGESTAASLGLPLGWMRGALIAVLALATGTAVAQTGLIAFVGLAAPHLVRSLVKATHARLALLSSLAGAVLLGAADLLARAVIAPREVPVGVLTAVLGGLYLLWRMHRQTAGAAP